MVRVSPLSARATPLKGCRAEPPLWARNRESAASREAAVPIASRKRRQTNSACARNPVCLFMCQLVLRRARLSLEPAELYKLAPVVGLQKLYQGRRLSTPLAWAEAESTSARRPRRYRPRANSEVVAASSSAPRLVSRYHSMARSGGRLPLSAGR